MTLAELCDRATAAFAELARGRSLDDGEDPTEVGASIVSLTLRLVAVHLAKGRRLVQATTVEDALDELRAHDLFRASAAGVFEGVPKALVLETFERLAGFDDAPIEALGAAYELLVDAGFSRARGPTAVVFGIAIDLAELEAVDRSRRAEHVAELVGAPLGRRAEKGLAGASSIDEVAHALRTKTNSAVVPPGGLVVARTLARRRAGSHYTPPELAELVADAALKPLFSKGETHSTAICDPAMGAGAILLAGARALERAGRSRKTIAERCLFGIDRDALAVSVARFGAWLFSGEAAPPSPKVAEHLVVGDALSLDLEIAFPEVMARGGFDGVIGNPPWVAYVGRAAQPLGEVERSFYTRAYRSFAGYRTLHGLFVERAAKITRAGGRIGLVLPTSVADLAGYAKVRAAHDAFAEADVDLPDFGADRFEGVFQPAMALFSTRRAVAVAGSEASWSLASAVLPPEVARLVARLAALPPLPPALFGERGIQTEGDDTRYMIEADAAEPPYTFAVREGRDVVPFAVHAPRVFLDPARVRAKIRPASAFAEVKLLIRQTARYPMAALGDGLPFRNSVLAAFEHPAIDTFALLAYLNSSAVRWLHFVRFRDARQGMPQLKIAHLRATPTPPALAACADRLRAIGGDLGLKNRGIEQAERELLDACVGDALELDDHERTLIAKWSRENPPPVAR